MDGMVVLLAMTDDSDAAMLAEMDEMERNRCRALCLDDARLQDTDDTVRVRRRGLTTERVALSPLLSLLSRVYSVLKSS